MKKSLFASMLLLLLVVIPSDAQVIRRPFVHRVIHSPIVQQVVEAGVSHYSPAAGAMLHEVNKHLESNTRIYVDSSVGKNLDATRDNLKDADAILKKLKFANPSATATTPANETKPGVGSNSDLPKSNKNADRKQLEDLFQKDR